MKTVLGYLRPYAGRAARGVLIKFSAAVLELILPLLLANVIDVLDGLLTLKGLCLIYGKNAG